MADQKQWKRVEMLEQRIGAIRPVCPDRTVLSVETRARLRKVLKQLLPLIRNGTIPPEMPEKALANGDNDKVRSCPASGMPTAGADRQEKYSVADLFRPVPQNKAPDRLANKQEENDQPEKAHTVSFVDLFRPLNPGTCSDHTDVGTAGIPSTAPQRSSKI